MNDSRNDHWTFYVHDPQYKRYVRLVIVKSMGLSYILAQKLMEIYPDNLYLMSGIGKLHLLEIEVDAAMLEKVDRQPA